MFFKFCLPFCNNSENFCCCSLAVLNAEKFAQNLKSKQYIYAKSKETINDSLIVSLKKKEKQMYSPIYLAPRYS